jgi:hypothetical protein
VIALVRFYAIGALEETVPDGPEWSYSTSQPRPPEGCSGTEAGIFLSAW